MLVVAVVVSVSATVMVIGIVLLLVMAIVMVIMEAMAIRMANRTVLVLVLVLLRARVLAMVVVMVVVVIVVLELEVLDRGPGYPDEVLENPFEPYVTNKAQGTGLGLAICRKIVADHDGRIRIENRANGGARASILLPLKAGEEATDRHELAG